MNKIFLLVIAVFLSACTSLEITTPTPIIETPEISGKEKTTLGISASAQAGHSLKITEDASSRPPVISPKAVHDLSTTANFHADFLKRVRLGVGGNPLSPIFGGLFGIAQIQLLGDGHSNAKSGNFSLSLFGHAGRVTTSPSGDQDGTFGPGGNNWKAELKNDWYDYGASAGIRISDSAMFFIGAAEQKSFYKGKIDHTQGTAPNGVYHSSEKSVAQKAQAGLSWGSERGEFHVAADYSEVDYAGADDLYITSVTLGFTVDIK